MELQSTHHQLTQFERTKMNIVSGNCPTSVLTGGGASKCVLARMVNRVQSCILVEHITLQNGVGMRRAARRNPLTFASYSDVPVGYSARKSLAALFHSMDRCP